jgi:hypothetical protein
MAKDEKENPNAAVEDLAAENQRLKETIQGLHMQIGKLQGQLKTAGVTEDIREAVALKMRHGLSEKDAIEVVRRQQAHDREVKEREAAEAAAKKKADDEAKSAKK